MRCYEVPVPQWLALLLPHGAMVAAQHRPAGGWHAIATASLVLRVTTCTTLPPEPHGEQRSQSASMVVATDAPVCALLTIGSSSTPWPAVWQRIASRLTCVQRAGRRSTNRRDRYAAAPVP